MSSGVNSVSGSCHSRHMQLQHPDFVIVAWITHLDLDEETIKWAPAAVDPLCSTGF